MKPRVIYIATGILLAGIFVMWLCAFQVQQSEIALVTTFGRPTLTITEPDGRPHFKMPPPIQRVHRFDRRIQNFEDKFEPTQTVDSNILMTMMYAGWQIKDPAQFFAKFASGSIAEPEKGSVAAAEATLKNMVRAAKAAVVSSHPLSDFISTDPAQLKFEAIEGEILANVQGQLKSNSYGVELKYVGIKKLGVPESVTQEVFKQMSSERSILVGNILSAGQREVTQIRNQANSDSQRILRQAEAEAKQIKGRGEQQAADSFKVFSQDPEFEEFLLQLEALKQSTQKQTTLILSGDTVPFNLLQNLSTNSTNSGGRKKP